MQLDGSNIRQTMTSDGGGARGRRLESTFFMINVIFLLLLFFVVAGNLNMDIAVSPPRADAMQPPAAAEARLVIAADGQLELNGATLELATLNEAVRALGKVTTLSVAADAGVDAVIVAQALQALAGLPVDQVSLLTLARTSSAPAPRP